MSVTHLPLHRRGGFTLIELLAVLAAAGILIGAVGAWGAIDRFGLTRAARLAE